MLVEGINEPIGMDHSIGPMQRTYALGAPILFRQNIPTAVFCATLTTVVLGGKPVIVAEFLACLNIALGDNPDRAFRYQDITVGVTGMIDVAGFVLERLPVNIVAVIEMKNVRVTLRESPQAFFFGNSGSDVLNDARAFFNILCGKQPLSGNT
jgi:hypothetical protein